ncbi:MAG: hypothetical protein SO373_08505 [Candidatus Borkfalkiaceae bacterium]|nr:hypothetical protein [Christensenellaceae bacterium]
MDCSNPVNVTEDIGKAIEKTKLANYRLTRTNEWFGVAVACKRAFERMDGSKA